MDPLSDVLSLLKPRSYLSGGLDVGAPLAIQFPRHDGIKCYTVVSGQAWLSGSMGSKWPIPRKGTSATRSPASDAFSK